MKLSELRRGKSSLDGAWILYPSGEPLSEPHPTEFCVCLAEDDNPTFRDVRARLYREHRASLLGGDEAAMQLRVKLDRRAVAEAILIGWANLSEEDGTPIPYSAAKAEEFLANRAMWKFAQFVTDASNLPRYYEEQVAADAVGN